MRKNTRMNRLLVVLAAALIAGVWTFTALVDTASAKKPTEPPGGGNSGGGGDGTTPVYHQVELGTLSVEAPFADPRAINDHGEVAGDAAVGPPPSPWRAFFLTPEDTDSDGLPDLWNRDTDGNGTNDLMIDLGWLPAYFDGQNTLEPFASETADVNNLGQVAGNSYFDETTVIHAMLVNPEDTDGDGLPDLWNRDVDGDGGNDLMIDLIGPGSGANAINDLGHVVGDYNLGEFGDAFVIAPVLVNGEPVWFVDADSDGANDLVVNLGFQGALDGAVSANAWDINNLGQVVGNVQNPEGGGTRSWSTRWMPTETEARTRGTVTTMEME